MNECQMTFGVDGDCISYGSAKTKTTIINC